MNGKYGDNAQGYSWKVGHQYASNNIPQMKSNSLQAPFIAGGNQTAYYLGLSSNAQTEGQPCTEGCYSQYEKTIKKHMRK